MIDIRIVPPKTKSRGDLRRAKSVAPPPGTKVKGSSYHNFGSVGYNPYANHPPVFRGKPPKVT